MLNKTLSEQPSTNLDMELPQGVKSTNKGDEVQKSVHPDDTSLGEKVNAPLVTTAMKAKPVKGAEVKSNSKLHTVNLDEICIKELIRALNREKGVVVVARYNCTDESVSNNIQLPLTPKQRNVRVKHARYQDARIRITTTRVKFLKSSKGSGLLSSVMPLIPETQHKVSHEGTYKIYHRDLEVCVKIRN